MADLRAQFDFLMDVRDKLSRGAKIDFIFPEDPKTAKAAINGKPLAAGVNRGRTAESMNGLARVAGGISDAKKPGRSWFKFGK